MDFIESTHSERPHMRLIPARLGREQSLSVHELGAREIGGHRGLQALPFVLAETLQVTTGLRVGRGEFFSGAATGGAPRRVDSEARVHCTGHRPKSQGRLIASHVFTESGAWK